MTDYGYFLSSEEFSPAELLDQARRAADAGFARLAVSDHYHPWNDTQGQSPFVWTGGTKVCWNRDRDKAVDTARRLWATELLPGELNQVLPSPRHFDEQASSLGAPESVAEAIPCGDDVDEHIERLRTYAHAGFDEVYVSRIGPDNEDFFADYLDASLLADPLALAPPLSM